MLQISINDGLTPDLREKLRQIGNTRGLMAACGKTLEVELREHFRLRNARPNRNGWPKRNFWNRVRNATALETVTQTEAEVVISDPAFRAKVDGPTTITPKRGKKLAIPARAEAYAAGSPREGMGDKLEPMIRYRGGRRTAVALVERPRTDISFRRRRGKVASKIIEEIQGGLVWYWLVDSVTIPRDPNALPPEGFVQARIDDTAREWIERIFAAQQAGGN